MPEHEVSQHLLPFGRTSEMSEIEVQTTASLRIESDQPIHLVPFPSFRVLHDASLCALDYRITLTGPVGLPDRLIAVDFRSV